MSKALEYFLEISKIPRSSKKEDLIRDYLVNWAKAKSFENKIDRAWNLIIYVPGKNCKTIESIVLQAHMDMVCVKTDDSKHNFSTDPIDIYEEGWFLKARWTSLGADNWIWIALAMSSVVYNSHPPYEIVFTIDEEEWMSWVLNLDFSLLSSKKVINLDSENENEICISSACGARINIKKEILRISWKMQQYKLEIFGMKWWHSWVEIHKNHWNTIKLLIDFLSEYGFSFEIVSINWWSADNVIPSNVKSILWIENLNLFEDALDKYFELYKQKTNCHDLDYKIEKCGDIEMIIEDKDFILSKIKDFNVWVLQMSQKIKWLVETSINLGIINLEWTQLELCYLPRSSNMEEFEKLLAKLEKHYGKDSWYALEIHSRYPGWQDNPDWELINIAREEFNKAIGKDPEIIAVHAWLECWAIVAWLWIWASAISIGPNMHDIHSVNEKVEIASIEKLELILEWILSRF